MGNAYSRGRGAEMHLKEMLDFLKLVGDRRNCVYLASVGVDGAFGQVPQSINLETFLGMH